MPIIYLTCPFCGSEHIFEHYAHSIEGNEHTVKCADCKGAGPTRSTAEEAREAWNRRPVNELAR